MLNSHFKTKTIISFLIYISIGLGLFYLLYWEYKNLDSLNHPIEYTNKNIPKGFLYTSPSERNISDDNTVENPYWDIDQINNERFEIQLRCIGKNDEVMPVKELIYYKYLGISRSALICNEIYYIQDYRGSLGPSLHGPFETPSTTTYKENEF